MPADFEVVTQIFDALYEPGKVFPLRTSWPCAVGSRSWRPSTPASSSGWPRPFTLKNRPEISSKTLQIGDRTVGPGQPCFIIAEAGVNHNGDLELAHRLIDAAVEARADAVKFQTFKAESVATAAAPKAAYQKQSTAADESQLDMVKRLELPLEAFGRLQQYATDRGILFLSTPFDYEKRRLPG